LREGERGLRERVWRQGKRNVKKWVVVTLPHFRRPIEPFFLTHLCAQAQKRCASTHPPRPKLKLTDGDEPNRPDETNGCRRERRRNERLGDGRVRDRRARGRGRARQRREEVGDERHLGERTRRTTTARLGEKRLPRERRRRRLRKRRRRSESSPCRRRRRSTIDDEESINQDEIETRALKFDLVARERETPGGAKRRPILNCRHKERALHLGHRAGNKDRPGRNS